jgi:hypothetical protein
MTEEEKKKWIDWLDRLKARIAKGDVDSMWSQTEPGPEMGEIKVINIRVFPAKGATRK